MNKLLLVLLLTLVGCDVHQTSSITGKLIGYDCTNLGCSLVIYDEGLLGTHSIRNIDACKGSYSGLIDTKVAAVLYPAEVPIIQKTETAIRQCYKVYPLRAAKQ